MLGALVDEIAANNIDRLAVVLDVRSRIMFDALGVAVNALDERGIDPAIVFLEASDETIVRRQESSRPAAQRHRRDPGDARRRPLLLGRASAAGRRAT